MDNVGWVCPQCHAVWSPSVKGCEYCARHSRPRPGVASRILCEYCGVYTPSDEIVPMITRGENVRTTRACPECAAILAKKGWTEIGKELR